MKVTKLKVVDYLDWLKDQEEFAIYQIELESEIANNSAVESLEEELQNIRDIKDIVKKWGEQ